MKCPTLCVSVAFALLAIQLSSCSLMASVIGGARFSPNDDFLVFSMREKSQATIYKLHLKSNDLLKLTSSGGRNLHPSYSPDGGKIVFSKTQTDEAGSQADLYLINADGTNETQLTSGAENDIFPVFSRDGQRILFVRARWFGSHSSFVNKAWHDMDVFLVNLDGSNLKNVTDGRYYELSGPSISPDDKSIIIRIGEQDFEDSLWMIPVDNPNAKKSLRPDLKGYLPDLAEKPWASEEVHYSEFYYPQFSPAGNLLLFVWAGHYQGYFGHEIYLMEINTRQTKKITNLKSSIIFPSFSSSGKSVVFLSDAKRKGHYDLWIMNVDGSGLKKISF